MRYICDELLLVVFRAPYLGCHVMKRPGEIAYLIASVYIRIVIVVSFGILLGSLGDVPYRAVYGKGEDYHH